VTVKRKSLYFHRQWCRLFAAEEEPFLKCVAFCAVRTKMAKLRQELLDTQELEVASSGLNNYAATSFFTDNLEICRVYSKKLDTT
jgi:hypothetical protein